MSRTARFLVFVSIAAAVVGALHYYILVHVIESLGLAGLAQTVVTVAAAGLFAFLVLAIPLGRALPRRFAQWIAWVAYVWLGTMWISFALWVLADLGVAIFGLLAPLLSVAPTEPFVRWAGTAVVALAGGLSLLALWSGGSRVRVRHRTIALRRLPEAASGLRIVQLTDLHIGPLLGARWLTKVAEDVNELEPDVVAITGDLVDGSVSSLGEHVKPLGAIKARQGVYFVTGNHEYYSGANEWIAFLSGLGIRVLRNECVTVSSSSGELVLDIAGIDDYQGRMLPGHGPNLAAALSGRDPSRPVVLLAHQPLAVREAAKYDVDLVLSGHTHGGQIWPWNFFVRLQQPYVRGVHRFPGSTTQLHVSNGTGFWGPPMRLGAPAEITAIALTVGQ